MQILYTVYNFPLLCQIWTQTKDKFNVIRNP